MVLGLCIHRVVRYIMSLSSWILVLGINLDKSGPSVGRLGNGMMFGGNGGDGV